MQELQSNVQLLLPYRGAWYERTVERFLQKTEVDELSGCWLWRGAVNDKKSDFPYGVFWLRGRKVYAHRAA